MLKRTGFDGYREFGGFLLPTQIGWQSQISTGMIRYGSIEVNAVEESDLKMPIQSIQSAAQLDDSRERPARKQAATDIGYPRHRPALVSGPRKVSPLIPSARGRGKRIFSAQHFPARGEFYAWQQILPLRGREGRGENSPKQNFAH